VETITIPLKMYQDLTRKEVQLEIVKFLHTNSSAKNKGKSYAGIEHGEFFESIGRLIGEIPDDKMGDLEAERKTDQVQELINDKEPKREIDIPF